MTKERLEVDDELQYEDDSGDEDLEVQEIPKEVRKLRTQAYDKSVSDLYSMIKGNDIILDPDYQRNYIWDNKKASLLVESILLNVPIPVVYVAEDEESRWVIVDGLQRLNSLRRFFDNEFKLSGLEVLTELKRQQFSTLNPKAQRMLKNGIIRVIVIKVESHPEIKYDIFERLNKGSITLNDQELRNCIFRGKFCDLLKGLREYKPYLQAIGLPEPHRRYYDSELILRFFAFNDAYDVSSEKVIDYPNKLKTFLNTYMEKHRFISPDDGESLGTLFKTTIEKVIAVFGSPAFRRIKPEDGTQDVRLNRALMDVIMVSFTRFTKEFLDSKKTAILELYRNLPAKDPAFNDALICGTSDTKKIEYRITTWLREISALEDNGSE